VIGADARQMVDDHSRMRILPYMRLMGGSACAFTEGHTASPSAAQAADERGPALRT